MLESTNPSHTHDGENMVESDDLVYNEGIILAGGYDAAELNGAIYAVSGFDGNNYLAYALGGFDGSQIMPSIEIYDPRRGTWMMGEPMNYSRMFSAAAVLKEFIYVIGGAESDNEAVNMIERYNEGQGWEITNSSALRKRDRSSAIVLEED